MARIFVAERQRTLDSSARRRVSADEVGAGSYDMQEGRALQALGKTISDIDRHKEDLNDRVLATMALDTKNQYYNEMRELLEDPKDGLYARKGAGAIGVYEEGLSKLNALKESKKGSLEGEQAKFIFDKSVSGATARKLDSLSRYEAKEIGRHQTQVKEDSVLGAYQEAKGAGATPESIEEAISSAEFVVRLNFTGESEEGLASEIRDMRNGVYKEAILNFMDQDPIKGFVYYDAVKDKLYSDTDKNIKRLLSQGADDYLYEALENDPYKVREGLAEGVYDDILSSKQRIKFKSLVNKQIKIYDGKRKRDAFVQESELNAELVAKFEAGDLDRSTLLKLRGSGVDEKLLAYLRDESLKLNKPTRESKDTSFVTLYQNISSANKKFDYGEDMPLEEVLRLRTSIYDELYKGNITARVAMTLNNRLLDVVQDGVATEEGEVDADDGFISRTFGAFRKKDLYDEGYDVIQKFLSRNDWEDNITLKSEMYTELVHQADNLSNSGQEITEEVLQKLASDVIRMPMQKRYPEMRRVLAGKEPNGILSDQGLIDYIKGDTGVKSEATVKGDYELREDKFGNRARVYKDGRIEEI